MPASTYGLETLARSDLQQHKLQVCENNWIRRIGVKRVERKRMKDLREEVGTKACIVGKIVEKEPDEMGWTHGQNITRYYRKDLMQRSKKVAENEEDHS